MATSSSGFITDALPALVCYLDVQQRYQFLNSAHEEWFGIPRSQFDGRTLRDVVDEPAYATMLPYIQRTLEGEDCTFEATLRPRGAATRHTRMTFSPHRNFSGQVEGFVALVTDVTAHKLSEGRNRLLADASKLARRLLRLPDRASSGRRARCARARRLVPIDISERGPDWPRFTGRASRRRPHVARARRAALSEPRSSRRDPERDDRVDQLAALSGGEPFEASDAGVIEELARRIALAVENAHLFDEAKRAVRLRDEFMSIASHELRTPLTALSLDLEIVRRHLERQNAEARTLERVNKVSMHLGRLNHLVGTLLDVSQIEAGRLAIHTEAMDLRVAVGEVIDRFTAQAARSKCDLRAHLPSEPVNGVWDPSRVDQILTNLLSNAVRYAPGGPIDIQLRARPGAGHPDGARSRSRHSPRGPGAHLRAFRARGVEARGSAALGWASGSRARS